MNNNKITYTIALIFIVIAFTFSCKKPDPKPSPSNKGKLNLSMNIYWDNAPLQYDTLMYINAAGNHYLVNEVQFFISEVTIYKAGKAKVLNGWQKEHYFDSNISTTMQWPFADDIEVGTYDSLSFTFGFSNADNVSFMFVNPPESQMFWPEYLGGGYHYMKLNGKWRLPSGDLAGSDFHLGRGQIRDAAGNITGFVDNSFRVSLSNSAFTISSDATTNVPLIMDVKEWFENPNIIDLNVIGGAIMEVQSTQILAKENGWDVFRVK